MPRLLALCASLTLCVLPCPAAARAIVSLTFDDTLEEHAQAAEMLEAHGLRGTFFVNSPRFDQPGYLSSDTVRALQAAGHEIGGHTVHHPRLAGLDRGEVERQICEDRATLLQAGIKAQTLAYPFGAADAAVQAAAADCGYNAARGVGGPGGETVPPDNPLYLRTIDSLQCDSDLEALRHSVRIAARSDRTTWFILVVHHLHSVCDMPYTLGWQDFSALLDWVAQETEANALQVRTLAEVLGGPTQPAVRGRPAPTRSPHGNLLQNPDLEAYSDPGRDAPDCWQQAGWGDNDYFWVRDLRSARGTSSQRVEVTRHVSGARRLVSSQDLGACAPTPMPGATYLLTGWYRSSVPVYWMVYLRDAQSVWRPWVKSPVFPAADAFSARMWRTPPVPESAEAMSVGLSIAGVGSLTVDEVSLQRWDEVAQAVRRAYEASPLPRRPPS